MYVRACLEAAVLSKTKKTSDPGILTSATCTDSGARVQCTPTDGQTQHRQTTCLASRSKQNGRNTLLLLFSPKLGCNDARHYHSPQIKATTQRTDQLKTPRPACEREGPEFCPSGQLFPTRNPQTCKKKK